VFYAGLGYRYASRRGKEWTTKAGGFFERPAFWKISPYQAYLLFPIFAIAGYAMPLKAWAGNTLLIIALEDIACVWRGSWVRAGEWTTTLFGSVGVGGGLVPAWWIPSVLLVLALYWVPL
jgi:hypothetical protein